MRRGEDTGQRSLGGSVPSGGLENGLKSLSQLRTL